jgi:hypothetical protein
MEPSWKNLDPLLFSAFPMTSILWCEALAWAWVRCFSLFSSWLSTAATRRVNSLR